jgi:hypothetical protein
MSQSNKEAEIILALQALQNNPKLRIRPAARLYKVPPSTLYDRYHGKPFRGDIIPNSRKLSNLEEQTISDYILDLDSRGLPPRLRGCGPISSHQLVPRKQSPRRLGYRYDPKWLN